MKKCKLFIILGLVMLLLTACSSSSALLGKWEIDGRGISVGTVGRISKIEFFSDGTYTSSAANYNGSYSVDGDRVRLSGMLMADLTYSFKVSGNTLTIYTDDGDEYVFNKSNN